MHSKMLPESKDAHQHYFLYLKLVFIMLRTNTGKQMLSFKAIDLWKSIPQYLKDLNVFTFSKNIKNFLLSEQYSK